MFRYILKDFLIYVQPTHSSLGVLGCSVMLGVPFLSQILHNWNGGPLSDSSLPGISYVAKMFCSLSNVVRNEVDIVCSTILQITTRL